MKSNENAKKIVTALAVPAFATAAIHVASSIILDRIVQYVELTYPSPKIGPSMDGYTAAFLTDIHAMPAAALTKVAEQVNARGVDLLLLGGDFPRGAALWRCLLILRRILATDGTYAVAGNHDAVPQYSKAMESMGMHFLGNEGRLIRHNLYLAGTEDLRVGRPSIDLAVAEANPEDFVLLLTHNPDTVVLQDRGRVDLALSGHTHGGQITFFGLWAPVMTISRHISHYGHRLRTGWARTPKGTDVYVSNGVGSHKSLPRMFARPQVIYLTLRSER